MDKPKIASLPGLPGVYFMKDASGEIIYIGKAASLRKRAGSYFRPKETLDGKTALMVSKVADIGFTVTASEEEALILEAALIKRNKPRYNISLKDDKSYPYLKLTERERYPRILLTRKLDNDGSTYYGPYTSARLLRKALETVHKIFPLRRCRALQKKPCLNYHIGRCQAPCGERISQRAYREIVDELKMFLDGRKDELLDALSAKMNDAARGRDFEKAAYYRDVAKGLSAIPSGAHKGTPYDELLALQHLLGMRRVPGRIEAFDISDIKGAYAVGSMIAFLGGKPSQKDYRKFRIRTVSGIDDYAMMREVVTRRYERVKAERLPRPDLVVIDGGKGHMRAATDVLRKIGFGDIPVIGIAKEFERIYIEGRQARLPPKETRGQEYVALSGNSAVLHLIQRLRDEAHRFAVGYHHLLMRKKMGASSLDGIKGIGPKRKKMLLEKFGSVGGIKAADIGQLRGAGIDRFTAKRMKESLR